MGFTPAFCTVTLRNSYRFPAEIGVYLLLLKYPKAGVFPPFGAKAKRFFHAATGQIGFPGSAATGIASTRSVNCTVLLHLKTTINIRSSITMSACTNCLDASKLLLDFGTRLEQRANVKKPINIADQQAS